MVDLIGLAEDLALPFARLLQQVAPGDLTVMRAGKDRAGDGGADRLVDILDQAIVEGDAGEHREIALGDREGHVGAGGVAPFGDDAPSLQDEAGRAAALAHRADDLGPGAALVPLDIPDIAAVRIVQAARPGTLLLAGEIDRGLQLLSVEAGLGGRDRLPEGAIGGGDEGIGRAGQGGILSERRKTRLVAPFGRKLHDPQDMCPPCRDALAPRPTRA